MYSCHNNNDKHIDLSEQWQFKIDSLDLGVSEKWYGQNFEENVKLPGSMVENGKGEEISLRTKWTGGVRNKEWQKDPNYAPYSDSDNIRFPFWLQPEKKYTGAAWYRKTVEVPENWKENNIWLKLERYRR